MPFALRRGSQPHEPQALRWKQVSVRLLLGHPLVLARGERANEAPRVGAQQTRDEARDVCRREQLARSPLACTRDGCCFVVVVREPAQPAR